MSAEKKEKVDRERTTPALVRVFPKVGAQHEAEDLAGTSGRGNGSPAGEVQIYTWRDATLKELSDLVRQVVPEARNTGVRLDFSLVYTDKSGRARSRRCGSISPSASSHQSDASVTLQSCRWQPGDFLSVAVHPLAS